MNKQDVPAQAPQLERGLGPLDATMIVVGSMIGSGIFITSSESVRLVGAPGWLLVAWALAGVLTISGALCCAELAAMLPHAGGQYVFLQQAYGRLTGFLFGWSLFLVIQTGTIAAVAIAFARFAGVFSSSISADHYIFAPRYLFYGYALSLSTEQLTALLLILLLTFSNTLGLRLGKLVQNVFTTTKTAALAGLVLLGLTLGWKVGAASGSAFFTSSWWHPWSNGWQPAVVQDNLPQWALASGSIALLMLLGRAMNGPLFAQSAWNNVTFMGAEVRNPGRNLPLALVAGCAIVVALYLLANLAYVVTLPLGAIQKAPQGRVGVAAVQAILGSKGALVMAAAIMVSTFGCCNGLILAGARVYYAMARDGLFFARVARLNKHRVPAVALLAQGAWAALLTLPRTIVMDAKTGLPAVNPATGAAVYGNVYTQLLEYIVSADLVFYGLMVGVVIVLRRTQPEVERPYRTFGYPVTPGIYIGLASLLILDLAYLAPRTSGWGYVVVLLGIPVYFLWRGRRRERRL